MTNITKYAIITLLVTIMFASISPCAATTWQSPDEDYGADFDYYDGYIVTDEDREAAKNDREVVVIFVIIIMIIAFVNYNDGR